MPQDAGLVLNYTGTMCLFIIKHYAPVLQAYRLQALWQLLHTFAWLPDAFV